MNWREGGSPFFYLELQPTTIAETIVGDLMSMTSESTKEIKIQA